MQQRGFFITFEGVEGSGKTTQIRCLAADLEAAGYPLVVTHEPGGTPISEQIRAIFLNPDYGEMVSTTELLLVCAARAQHVSEVIRPALEAGKIVISDRFADATVAYQGYRGGLDLELIHRMNDIATEGLVPDLTIVLDLPVEIGLDRVRRGRASMDRLELEDIENHRRVREGYLAIASEEPNRVVVIDTQTSPNRASAQVKALVDQRIKGSGALGIRH